MHSVLDTIILGWGAVYGYAAFYAFALYRQRPERKEYLTFALVAVSLMVECAGGVVLTGAEDLATGDLGTRLRMIGSVCTLAFIHHFAVHLAGAKWDGLVKLGYAYALINTLLAITGLATVPGEEAPPPAWGFAAAPDYLEPRLSIAGSVAGSVGWLVVASTLVAFARASRQDRRARLVLWAFVVNCTIVVHDSLITVASLRSYYLAEHAALLTMAAVSAILLDRYTRTSEALDVRTRQLSTSVGELRHTEAELVKKEQLAAVGALSGLIANQVEKPLSNIHHTTSGLRDDAVTDTRRSELLASLEAEVDGLNRLVEDLLAYARPVKLQARPVALHELIEDCLSRIAPDKDVESTFDVDRRQPVIYGDGDFLHTALTDIIDNAVAAMPDGGTLSIRARADDGGEAVTITVEDSGRGMDAETLARARDPFFTTDSRGTGMGLAIVERIVKLHDGTMELASEPGRGTTVRLTLPVGAPTSGSSGSSSDDEGRKREETVR